MRALVLLFAAVFCAAQDSGTSPHFEVASVKPVPEGARLGFYGGPGSTDPGRVHYGSASVRDLIGDALHAGPELISGPAALDVRYQIDAKLPPGTTIDQYREMVRNLLTERFGLTYHQVEKEVAGYELVVAPGGPKESLQPASSAPQQGRPFLSKTRYEDGLIRITFRSAPMALVANRIAVAFSGGTPPDPKMPVVNKTGLTGKCDFDLDLPAGPALDGGAVADPKSASAALEKQFGLKLNPVRVTVENIVVDHVEKVPTDN